MAKDYLELYTDYLISNRGLATATGLSEMTDAEVSHDQITRYLSGALFDSKHLWKQVKPVVREVQSDDACIIFDDTVLEKQWTDENDIVCWHFDHTKGRNVKGVNLLNMVYHSNDVSIPIGFEVIHKHAYCELDSKEQKRKAWVTKNELMRAMLQTALNNQIPFRFVLMDSWFADTENFEYIVKRKKEFITAVKSNRYFAPSLEAKHQGQFHRVDALELKDKQALRGYLKGYDREVLLVRRIFTNKDGSSGTLDLICSDTSLDGNHVATIYQKRWKVEEYHKSLKSNAAVGKSPTKTITTQMNHIFLSIMAVFKLECLKIKHSLNHFAIRAKLLIKANQIAFAELQRLKGA
ncbi:MAG: transposase [Campylobacterales bacterium]|nr:transposase [Campylobacterales bacterium]